MPSAQEKVEPDLVIIFMGTAKQIGEFDVKQPLLWFASIVSVDNVIMLINNPNQNKHLLN